MKPAAESGSRREVLPLRGLYAITSAALCAEPQRLLAGVAAALQGGARVIQYRDKHSISPAQRERNVAALLQLCRESQARLIINDDVELAARIGADGVHLGAADPPLALARARLGHVAFGRFFASNTKPDAPQAALELLVQARAHFNHLRIPICAIGGVTPATAVGLIAAGADLVAAVEGVFGDLRPGAITAAARAYAELFESPDIRY
jgi:thiamine-phosphate pyrophosphorylase